jgi:GntR family transcriptional regulator
LAIRAIDLTNPTPYYAQLASILRATIATQQWKPGHQLPSEAELEQTYGVSRTVVRQALNVLAAEGLVYRRKGKGSFVAERKYTPALFETLASFYDEMAARGHPPVSKILTLQRQPASGEVAAALRMADGAAVIKLRRLRFVENVPVVLSTSHLPYDLCPSLIEEDLSRKSLYKFLETAYGLEIATGTRRIEAVAAGKDDARMLEIKLGAPLLVVRSTTCLRDGRPIDFSISKHRADRTQFETHLVRAPQPRPLSPMAGR